ncbi:MAG: hypothetical protein IJT16_06880 [Lachnospiraceae bacterium]|nr:hypothetical protein [Lachnospiraceae bacterium]
MDVGSVTGIAGITAAANSNANQTSKTEEKSEVKKYSVSGKTVGEPKLSEKGKKYYDELKSKYGNLDFVLVSSDKKEVAKANAGSFANPDKMVVLIDEEKIERMAEDENFRKQYEGVIQAAQSGLPKLKEAFGNSANVKGYGMQVGDNGETSFFAVMKKSSDQMTASQQKRTEKKKAEKKAAEKKAEKKKAEEAKKERLEEKRAERSGKSEKSEKTKDDYADNSKELSVAGISTRNSSRDEDEDVEIITASSVEDLIRKVEDYNYASRADQVRTEEELMVGSHIDFRG